MKKSDRKHRHRANNQLKNPKSVRRHTRISGRTGAIKSKQTPSSKTLILKRTIV